MIGLRNGTVRVVEHHAQWAELFEAEARFLREEIADLIADIQHVGSTAVPGLPAKPIIDIAVAVRESGDISALADRLTRYSYIYRGDSGQNGGHLVVKEPQPGVRTVHIHIVEIDDDQWHSWQKFRDALRDDAVLRERYSCLKRELARKHAGDRRSYTAGKDHFITKALADKRDSL